MSQLTCAPAFQPLMSCVRVNGRRELRVEPVVTRENREVRFVAGRGVGDVEVLQFFRFAQRDQFGTFFQRLLERVWQVDFIRRGVQPVREVQRNVFPDVARQIVAEQVRQIIFGDAIIISRLKQRRTRVGHGNLRAQHVEIRHRARVITMLLVVQFLLQQVDGSFVHGDLFRREQNVIIRQPHGQQRVRERRLVLRQCLFLRDLRRADRRDQFAALINGLDDLHARVPVLVRLRYGGARSSRRKTFHRARFGVLVLAGRVQLRQRDRPRLHHHAILGFEIVFRLENRGVLRERDVQRIGQRKRPRQPVGAELVSVAATAKVKPRNSESSVSFFITTGASYHSVS